MLRTAGALNVHPRLPSGAARWRHLGLRRGSNSPTSGPYKAISVGLKRALHWACRRYNSAVSRFDEDTSVMRVRREATLIELLKPELSPQSKARGIVHGVLLGAVLWAALITLGVTIWHRLNS